MKYLVIAEKPSVSKSIAKVIGAYRQEDGYLEGGDCVVSWCLGHLAEYAAPEHYDERYENWRFEDLPILPVEWKLLVHNTKKPQFNVLRKLLRSKKFDYVVNACDAGREGEAIFRRVYALAGSKLPMGYDYKQASPIFWCREGQELIGQTKCSSEIFQANDIENAVFQALKKELSLLGSLYGDIKKEEQSLKEASRKASRRKTSMEQELKNLKGEKMRMYEEYAAGTLSLDNYKNKKQEYDRKIAEVQDKIEQSKAEEAAQSVVPGTVRAAAEQAENFLHGTRLTASMVSAFIENVYVHEGGRIVVQFKYEQSIQDAVRALHTD